MGIEPGSRRAVFLDRDGVIVRAAVRAGRPYPVDRVDDARLLPGVREALLRLRAAGFLLVVVTNQPDVARGRSTREAVEAIHEWLRAHLPLDGIRACYHDDRDGCACRKPAPGLLNSSSTARRRVFSCKRAFWMAAAVRSARALRREISCVL